jgi:N-(2-amino-2-carboxyethyl)-L-glutamate synthase
MAKRRTADARRRAIGSLAEPGENDRRPRSLEPAYQKSGEPLDGFRRSVGGTPIVRIQVDLDGMLRSIFVKLESMNPCGSIKDRTALGLVESVGISRIHREQLSIVESTSGNLGIALATIADIAGFPFIAVVDPRTPQFALREMRSRGAQIEMVAEADTVGGFLEARIRRAADLCGHFSRRVWLNQYANEANPRAHYLTTAPEIDRQMGGVIDSLFVPVSTGGTLAGVARYFRATHPETRIVAVDALGSTVMGGPSAPRRLTGIGASQTSTFIRSWHFDEVSYVTDAEAFAFCRALASDTRILLGGSSGAVLAACCRELARHSGLRKPVCLAPDGGDRYVDTIYDDEWVGREDLAAGSALLDPLGTGKAIRFTVTGETRARS